MSSHRDVAGIMKKHNYIEIRKIGEGSFGKAILVQCEDSSKLVCKMVDVSQASSKETQDAIKEGKLLASFKHPYIVRYRESFIDSGWLCILMDYCEGGDLSKILEQAKKKRQPISEEQVLKWIAQALLALKYIHDKHVLHRDLKSSNFFLTKSNNLKLGDFGIAKVLSCTAACARTQIGTPYYLSPEVCQEKPYSWSSDIWAMGCILYELCMLKVPFDASNISGLVQKICRGPTPIISTGYSDFTKALCSEMLSRNPSGRPGADTVLQRPEMQAIVKRMLEEAQQAQAEGGADSGDGKKIIDSVPQAPLGHARGAYMECAGYYKRNDLVEYHSATHKEWLPATVINVDGEGRIIIDLKPNTWISLDQQSQGVRPRRSSPQPVGCGGVATPLRQRSPSMGAQIGSARGATPRKSYDMIPNAQARDFTPSRLREISPSYRHVAAGYQAGVNGRAPSPNLFRGREPSLERLAREARARIDSRFDGGSRVASPRVGSPRAANGPAYGHRRSEPPLGMPRVPGSPLHRMSPAIGAGMAIAGV